MLQTAAMLDIIGERSPHHTIACAKSIWEDEKIKKLPAAEELLISTENDVHVCQLHFFSDLKKFLNLNTELKVSDQLLKMRLKNWG